MDKKKIVFVSSNKINDFAHELIERVFEISGAWMSNESILDDFESLDSIPGHDLVRLSEIPKSDRHLYKKEFSESTIKPKNYLVWYPPVSAKEWSKIESITRGCFLDKVANAYKISMEDYPKGEPLYVWKVAEFVKRKLRES